MCKEEIMVHNTANPGLSRWHQGERRGWVLQASAETASLKWTAQHIGMHGLAVSTSLIF